MSDKVTPFLRLDCDTPEQVLRDALATAAAGDLKAVVVVGLTRSGEVLSAGSGYDEGRFTLLGGLVMMQRDILRGVD